MPVDRRLLAAKLRTSPTAAADAIGDLLDGLEERVEALEEGGGGVPDIEDGPSFMMASYAAVNAMVLRGERTLGYTPFERVVTRIWICASSGVAAHLTAYAGFTLRVRAADGTDLGELGTIAITPSGTGDLEPFEVASGELAFMTTIPAGGGVSFEDFQNAPTGMALPDLWLGIDVEPPSE